MKIAAWNINSLRQRLPHLLEWLAAHRPEVFLLQETKVTDDKFPGMELEEMGYNLAFCGEKTFNGVAILSKYPLEDITRALPGDESDSQCRYIEAVVNSPGAPVRVASVYVPNGQSPDSDKFVYKLAFLERLRCHAEKLLNYEEMLVLGGDYNIAPEAADVYDPRKCAGQICFHPKERAAWRRLLNLGLYDAFRLVHPAARQFSWWDYRTRQFERDEGMRIDHLLLSPQAADRLQQAGIDAAPRAQEKPSDHAPVWCEIATQ